jgi:cell division protein FtsZ
MTKSQTNTLVVGVGGAGTNIVVAASQQMPNAAQYMVANTDAQSLKSVQQHYPAISTLLLGPNICKGQPTAGSVNLGYKAAMESLASIKEKLAEVESLVIVAGLGGGTGTGAASVFVKIGTTLCQSIAAIVARPFDFEEPARRKSAETFIRKLKSQTATLIIVDNEEERKPMSHTQEFDVVIKTINIRIANE